MEKRLLSLVLCLCMLVGMIPVSNVYAEGMSSDPQIKDIVVLGQSGSLVSREEPEKLFDDNHLGTKWCVTANQGWVVFDLGRNYTVSGMKAYHAGQAANEWDQQNAGNTKAYALQRYNGTEESPRPEEYGQDDKWTTIAEETDNTMPEKETLSTSTEVCRYLRLNVTESGDPGTNKAVRFYGLEIFGKRIIKDPVNVHFLAGEGGTGTMESVLLEKGDKYIIPDSAYSNNTPGQRFAGWQMGQDVLMAGDSIIVNEDVTLTAIWREPVDKSKVSVTYLDKDGVEQTVEAEPLLDQTELTSGWYVVNTIYSSKHTIRIYGDVKLILQDGCRYALTGSMVSGGVSQSKEHLQVFGQTAGTGKISIQTDDVQAMFISGDMSVYGGTVYLETQKFIEATYALNIKGNLTVQGKEGREPLVSLSGGKQPLYCCGNVNVTYGKIQAEIDKDSMIGGKPRAINIEKSLFVNEGKITCNCIPTGENMGMRVANMQVEGKSSEINVTVGTKGGIEVAPFRHDDEMTEKGRLVVNDGTININCNSDWRAALEVRNDIIVTGGSINIEGSNRSINVNYGDLTVSGNGVISNQQTNSEVLIHNGSVFVKDNAFFDNKENNMRIIQGTIQHTGGLLKIGNEIEGKGNITLQKPLTVEVNNALRLYPDAKIDPAGFTITNNGVIAMPDTASVEDIKALKLAGSGRVTIKGQFYTNAGEKTENAIPGQDITNTGIDFSLNAPLATTFYPAGQGTLTFIPAKEGEEGPTIVLNNVSIHGTDANVAAIKLVPDEINNGDSGITTVRFKIEGQNNVDSIISHNTSIEGDGTLNIAHRFDVNRFLDGSITENLNAIVHTECVELNGMVTVRNSVYGNVVLKDSVEDAIGEWMNADSKTQNVKFNVLTGSTLTIPEGKHLTVLDVSNMMNTGTIINNSQEGICLYVSPDLYEREIRTIINKMHLTGTGKVKVLKCTYPEQQNISYYENSYDLETLQEIYGMSMSLANSLEMNFYLKNTDLPEDKTGLQAKITMYDDDNKVVKTTKIPYSDKEHWKTRGSHLNYVIYEGVPAKQMHYDVEFAVFDKDGKQITETYSASAYKYCMELAANKDSEKIRTLVADMLVYGGSAQRFFHYEPSIGFLDSESNMSWLKQYATPAGNENLEDKSKMGTNYKGCSLVLKSKIEYRMYFQDLENNIDNHQLTAKVTYVDHYGNNKEWIYSEDVFIKDKSLLEYGIEVKDLALPDVNQLLTVKVYDENGNVIADTVDSVESYLVRLNDAGYQEISSAIMRFAASSRNYFDSKKQ